MPRSPRRLTEGYRAEKRIDAGRQDGIVGKMDRDAKQQIKREPSSSPSPPRFPQAFCDAFRFTPLPSRVLRSSIKREREDDDGQRSNVDALVAGKKRIKKEGNEVLPEVPDHIKDDVDILFIGSNPGRMSSQKGQHFSHPSNHFYRALHRSGLTPRQMMPREDYAMLEQSAPFLSLGLTNLAARPTRMAQEVDRKENALGAQILLALIRRYRPCVGVFVGIGVAKAFEQSLEQASKLKRDGESKKAAGGEGCAKVEKQEDMDATLDSPLDGHDSIWMQVPCDVPLVSDTDLGVGVGLLPIAVRHHRGESKDERNSDHKTSRPPYTLLYACPSTSGRVTSHQLPQKVECMRRARILTESCLRSSSILGGATSANSSSKMVQLRPI